MRSKINERRIVLSSIYLILLLVVNIILFSMLMLSSSPWLLFDNPFETFRYNMALAIPNVPSNNNTSNLTSTTTTNYPPESIVGPDRTVNENTTVILVGGAIDRNTNDKLSYLWTQTAGPPIALNGSNTTSATFISPSVSSDTTLKFSLTANDDKGATSAIPAIATVIVKPINNPPIADAGLDQTVNIGNIISLDGSNSTDPDGDSLSYLWTQVDGPQVTLNGTSTPMPVFIAPSNISTDVALVFQLTVKDDKNSTAVDNTKITAEYVPPPNQPPIANVGSDQTVDAGDSVTLDGSGSTDSDGSISSYSWIQIEGPSVTLSDASASSPTFTAPSVSTDTTLKFSLIVKDDKGDTSSPADVSVTLDAVTLTPTPAPEQSTEMKQQTDVPTNQSTVDSSNQYYFKTKWSTGTDSGFNDSPEGVAVDSLGNVYITETYVHRIQKFDSNGNFITQWGTKGSEDGQFNVAVDVAVDSSDNVYVAERINNRIQKFDSNGNFITKWGSNGSEDGQFDYPEGIATDSSDNVYVADDGNDRIQKFDSNGNFIAKWETEERGRERDLAVDSSDNVYVLDDGNSRIQKFDSDGNSITQWGSYGYGDGQFLSARGIDVDSSDNVYVADTNSHRIQKFDSDGNFITKWGSEGSGDGQFQSPESVAVDSSYNVYVADYDFRIQVFSPTTSTE